MVIKVGIDDGHGLRDPTNTKENPGKRTPMFSDGHYILEDVFNKGAARFFEAACKRHGFDTLQLAPEDYNVTLDERVRRANVWGGNFVFSFHFDFIGDDGNWNDNVGGYAVFYQQGCVDSQKLAECIARRMQGGTQQKNRGARPNDLQITRETNGTAVLIECGFMSNHYEASLMEQEKFQKECAEEACAGLCDCIGIAYIPEAGGENAMNIAVVTFEGYHDAGAADILAYLLRGRAVHIADITEEESNTMGPKYAVGKFEGYAVPAGFTPIKGTDRADTLVQVLRIGGRI